MCFKQFAYLAKYLFLFFLVNQTFMIQFILLPIADLATNCLTYLNINILNVTKFKCCLTSEVLYQSFMT